MFGQTKYSSRSWRGRGALASVPTLLSVWWGKGHTGTEAGESSWRLPHPLSTGSLSAQSFPQADGLLSFCHFRGFKPLTPTRSPGVTGIPSHTRSLESWQSKCFSLLAYQEMLPLSQLHSPPCRYSCRIGWVCFFPAKFAGVNFDHF